MERSENSIKYTEGKKNDTLSKVEDAIKLIKSQDREVTRKELLELAGVSSSVLCKPYVKELLKKHEVLMFKPTVILEKKGGDTYNALKKQMETLSKKLQKRERQLKDKELLVETKNKYIVTLQEKLKDTEEENAILRGKNQQILEYLYRKGMNDEQINDLFKY